MSDASQLNTSEPRAFLHKEILFWSKYGRIVFKLFGQFQQFFFVVHPLVIDDSRPKAFVYDADFGDLSYQALGLAEHKPSRVIFVDYKNEKSAPEGTVAYRDYVVGQSDENPPIDFHPHIYD